MVRRKNPLRKRLWRELRAEAPRYLALFLLMTFTISFVSGFLVAERSMMLSYNESFEKYNIEDGHFTATEKLGPARITRIEELGVSLYENFYLEIETDSGSTLRIFKDREEVDLVCLMKGALPETEDEIALDRMYAVNNDISVGDEITAGGRTLTVTGLVALSDYSALFSDNADTMFDAVQFGVAVMTPEGFSAFSGRKINYQYAWLYDDPPADEKEEQEKSEDFVTALARMVQLSEYTPAYVNQAIHFTGDDMGSDKSMMEALLYIIFAILAFVFAVTTASTISREAGVIGTLRATGYTQRELLVHYMCLPLLVTLVSALVGNVLGYTLLKDVCAGMYYASYSLTTYTTRWSTEAFWKTTLIPCAITVVVSWAVLRRTLSLPPLKFLRHDLSRRKHKRAFYLSPKIPFFTRYRLRIIFQNLGNYAVLFVGILFADLLLMFGLGLPAILDHYQETIGDQMLAKYQYILTMPASMADDSFRLENMLGQLFAGYSVKTSNPDAEEFSVTRLQYVIPERTEDVTVYGVNPGSDYVSLPDADGVFISSAFAEKFSLGAGDEITLTDPYGDETYTLTVTGTKTYYGAVAVFMSRSALNELLGDDEDAFSGYFSDTEITDISKEYVGSVIDLDAMLKVSRQLDVSMGSMMYLVDGFAVAIFIILMYLISKLVIEKSALAISLNRILGYRSGEIGRLYILATSLVTAICLVVCLPLAEIMLKALYFKLLLTSMAGWLPFYLPASLYVKMVVLGAVSYGIVALIELRRIRKIPMQEALKNAE